jgi:hypothetical protein
MSTFGFIDIFNNVHVLLIYHGGQIYWWRGGFPDKTTDLLQVADKHYNSKMFHLPLITGRLWFMVFNATFNNISVIS